MGIKENTLAQWRAWQTAQGLSHRTIDERERFISSFLTEVNTDPLGILPQHIIAYMGRPSLGRSGRATYHSHLRAYSRWLIRTKQRADDPTMETPTPRHPKGLPRPVTRTNLTDTLLAADRPRTRMMILLASLQGLRIHEIAKIRGEDIDMDGLNMTVTGKGNKTAYLPLHETVALFAVNFPRYGYWFPSGDGCVQSKSVGITITRTMRRAGVRGTPHMLRHFFASSLVQNGVDLRTIQQLLRHESLATTQIYTQVTDHARRTAMDGLRLVS